MQRERIFPRIAPRVLEALMPTAASEVLHGPAELLLREADHWIKNSLQLVSAMLRLQGKRQTGATARALAVGCRARPCGGRATRRDVWADRNRIRDECARGRGDRV